MTSHKKFKQWQVSELDEEAKKYTSRGEFFLKSQSAYASAQRKGVLDAVCDHMNLNARADMFPHKGIDAIKSGDLMLARRVSNSKILRSYVCYLQVSDVIKITSIEKRSFIHASEIYVSPVSLAEIQSAFPKAFVLIRRGCLISVAHIAQFDRPNGVMVLKDGTKEHMSRRACADYSSKEIWTKKNQRHS